MAAGHLYTIHKRNISGTNWQERRALILLALVRVCHGVGEGPDWETSCLGKGHFASITKDFTKEEAASLAARLLMIKRDNGDSAA